MRNEVKGAYSGFFLFTLLLFRFLVSENTLYLFVSLGMLCAALLAIIHIKKYNHKWYYLVFIPLFVLQGLSLLYTYLFQLKTLDLPYMLAFYCFVIIWILLASLLIYHLYQLYKQKFKKNKEDLKRNNS